MKISSPLKRVGGKSAAAQRILSLFPDPGSYDLYCEPCGGAAWVLLAKPAYHHQEVFNDLDNNLITFWQEIQVHADDMRARLDGLLYSRKVYYEFYRSLFDGSSLPPLERAVRYFYCLRATGTGWLRKSPVGWNFATKNIHAYHGALDLFERVRERFRYVAIDNRDILATITRYDSPRTFFYIDPPYVGVEQYYEASKGGFPHQELATTLAGIQGYAALSYYLHPEVDRLYPASHWRRTSWTQHKPSTLTIECPPEDQRATELLLCNYPAPVQSLWNDNDDLPCEDLEIENTGVA